MSRFQQIDIFHEVYELCHDLLGDINQQLTYFRASVYKNETAEILRTQIGALRCLVEMIPDELVYEPFLDYDAELSNIIAPAPGECTFSGRVSRLLQGLHASLDSLKAHYRQNEHINHDHKNTFAANVYRNRSKILSICQPGSRSWTFFERL